MNNYPTSSGSPFGLLHPRQPNTHGSAAWLTVREATRHPDLVKPAGRPFLGFLPGGGRGRADVPLYMPNNGHAISVAPTRAGKTASHVLTNLLSSSGSFLVLDVKGENYAISQSFRSTLTKVLPFAPFQPGTLRWNPLDQVRVGGAGAPNQADEQEDIRYLVDLMVIPGAAKDPYWDNAAKRVIELFMHHVCTAELTGIRNGPGVTERTMAEVVRLMSQPPDLFRETLEDMLQAGSKAVRQNAGILKQTQLSPEQFTGVMTNALEHLRVWSYDRVAEATSTSDFSFSQLRREPTTIYLIVPPEEIAWLRPLLRVMIGWSLRELKWAHRENPQPVTLLLDEFPQLAHMQPIEDILAYGAGFNLLVWVFLQDLSQLRRFYPETWQTFIAGASVRAFYGVRELDTAKLVSEMVGQATVASYGYTESAGHSLSFGQSDTHGWSGMSQSSSTSESRTKGYSSSFGRNLSYVGRRLITPEEVLGLNPFEQVLFIANYPPIRAALLPYYKHKELSERAEPWTG